MQYKVTKIDKEYDSGDIDITTDMWYELLKDPKAEPYMDALVIFLREPYHKSSCYLVGKKYDEDPQHFNAKITNFGKWVNSQLNDFSMIGADGKQTYWAIPMRYGWETKDGFVWQLRTELVKALQRLLLEQLIAKFQKQYSVDDSDVKKELYKWHLLQDCSNKTDLEIAHSLIGKNIIDNAHADSVLKYLLKEKTSDFNKCISGLFAESIDLDERLFVFKATMRNLCPVDWKNCANDERTASALLTCKYPQKYTFYMYKVYNSICLHFGIEQVKTGMIYSHFMRIVRSITVKYGDVLQDTISEEIASYEIAPKLLAVQTMFWVMLNEMNKEIETNQEVCQEENVIMDKSYLQEYIDLLEANHNIILNGAPGTGKTYLAKEIAEKMGAKVKMVQFHPSYDYTDFVEGLRPIKDGKGNIGFERKDGVFKGFCKKALGSSLQKNVQIQHASSVNFSTDSSFAALYEQLKNRINSHSVVLYSDYRNSLKQMNVKVEGRDIKFEKSGNMQRAIPRYVERIFNYYRSKKVFDIRDTRFDDYTRIIGNTIDYSYYRGIVQELLNMANKQPVEEVLETPMAPELDNDIVSKKTPYVFIIDEINRGEISKIFGELFFSIDPGYRGEKGKVQTQYQNLVEDGDVFKDGFFVPENVYIIGTMNDIDRSVESMDFAMRRRFAWHEVTAEESAKNMGLNEKLTLRMTRLNEVISNTEGLGSAYHVGGSFFLKVQNGEMTVESLWNLNLKSLMKEYLRGLPDADEVLESMEKAYFLKGQESVGDNEE